MADSRKSSPNSSDNYPTKEDLIVISLSSQNSDNLPEVDDSTTVSYPQPCYGVLETDSQPLIDEVGLPYYTVKNIHSSNIFVLNNRSPLPVARARNQLSERPDRLGKINAMVRCQGPRQLRQHSSERIIGIKRERPHFAQSYDVEANIPCKRRRSDEVSEEESSSDVMGESEGVCDLVRKARDAPPGPLPSFQEAFNMPRCSSLRFTRPLPLLKLQYKTQIPLPLPRFGGFTEQGSGTPEGVQLPVPLPEYDDFLAENYAEDNDYWPEPLEVANEYLRQHTELGDNDPDIEDNDPDLGDNDPDVGDNDPDVGDNDPDIGDNDPDIGDNDPDIGDYDPDIGDNDPDIGNVVDGNWYVNRIDLDENTIIANLEDDTMSLTEYEYFDEYFSFNAANSSNSSTSGGSQSKPDWCICFEICECDSRSSLRRESVETVVSPSSETFSENIRTKDQEESSTTKSRDCSSAYPYNINSLNSPNGSNLNESQNNLPLFTNNRTDGVLRPITKNFINNTKDTSKHNLPHTVTSGVEWANAPEFIPQGSKPKSYAEVVHPKSEELQGESSKTPVCPYIQRTGVCRLIPNCQYVHGETCELCGCAVLHPTDTQQRKTHHQKCMAHHERQMELSFAVARSKDKTCGICFEVVTEKQIHDRRFGILAQCNHCFCLSCIRKWRKAREFEHKVVKACPECRVTSDFVCPSSYWVDTQEDKDKLISNYKKVLAVKPCKYFRQGNGKCPFGNKCFYLHALPNGTKADVGPPPRRRRQNRNRHREERELSDTLHQLFLLDFLEEPEHHFLYSISDDIEELVAFFSDSDESEWSDYEFLLD